jgi:hypothetical protein
MGHLAVVASPLVNGLDRKGHVGVQTPDLGFFLYFHSRLTIILSDLPGLAVPAHIDGEQRSH